MKKITDYFSIKELVDEDVYNKYRESAWRFICPMLQETLLAIRVSIDKPITINDWAWGGRFTQRGLRHNQSDLVKSKKRIYLSAHIFGKAVDFDVKGMTAQEVRSWIVENKQILPYPIRLERNMNGKPKYTCHEYREEMILLGLKNRLNAEDLKEEEKAILKEIEELEKKMDMN